MAKFSGLIGYVTDLEVSPGVYITEPIEKPYVGDLIKNFSRRENTDVNGKTTIANDISIIADPYAYEHFHEIAYVKFNLPRISGAWSVNNVTVEHPRLTISLGGVYNGETK